MDVDFPADLILAQRAGPGLRAEIRPRVQALFPRLVSWHRYLATQRDPEASGLVTTYHPWEGTDNSPRWDRALARITVAELGPYTRLDTRALPDPSQRPTNWDYDRYLGLVGLLRKYRYDDALIYREYPFLIKDVFFSAVLVAANDALLGLADVAGASDEVRGQLAGWRDRGRAGLSIYAASKAAVRSLARTWANELAHRGIRVNVVVAGSTATPGSDSLAAQTNPSSSVGEFRAARVATIPLGRFADPVEIANAAVFLASDLSSFITGSTVTADGGFNQV